MSTPMMDNMDIIEDTALFDCLEPDFDSFLIDDYEQKDLQTFLSSSSSEDGYQPGSDSSRKSISTWSFGSQNTPDSSHDYTTSPTEKGLPFDFVNQGSVAQEKKQVSPLAGTAPCNLTFW